MENLGAVITKVITAIDIGYYHLRTFKKRHFFRNFGESKVPTCNLLVN